VTLKGFLFGSQFYRVYRRFTSSFLELFFARFFARFLCSRDSYVLKHEYREQKLAGKKRAKKIFITQEYREQTNGWEKTREKIFSINKRISRTKIGGKKSAKKSGKKTRVKFFS